MICYRNLKVKKGTLVETEGERLPPIVQAGLTRLLHDNIDCKY